MSVMEWEMPAIAGSSTRCELTEHGGGGGGGGLGCHKIKLILVVVVNTLEARQNG